MPGSLAVYTTVSTFLVTTMAYWAYQARRQFYPTVGEIAVPSRPQAT